MAFFWSVLSGALSAVGLITPWFTAYWLPGVVFGTLVAAPAARAAGRGWFGTAISVVACVLAWWIAVFCYFGSMIPKDVSFLAWTVSGGAMGAAVVMAGVVGVSSKTAWRRIFVALLTGCVMSCLIAILWQWRPLSGWPWLVQMAGCMTLWQGGMHRLLIEPAITIGRSGQRKVSSGVVAPIVFVLAATMAVVPAIAVTQGAIPHVVQTSPRQHDVAVDPELAKIVFEFSEDMQPAFGDIVQAMADTVPEIRQNIRQENVWVTPRQMVIPVVLQPGREYVIALNTVTRSNIRDIHNRPAEPFVLAFKTRGGATNRTLPTDLNRKSTTHLQRLIDQEYSHRDFQQVDWDVRFAEFEDRLIASRTGDEFSLWMTALLAPGKDGHLWVKRYDRFWPTWIATYEPNVSHETIQTVVPCWQTRNNFLEEGEFADGIRYLAITNLNAKNLPVIFDCFWLGWRLLGDHPLVLDLRLNGGGSDVIASVISSCFVTRPKVFAKTMHPDRRLPKGFGPTHSRILSPAYFAPHQTGPVAVLVGPKIASSAESFFCMMRQADDARIFGQPSRGSTGNPKHYILENGVEVMVPSWVMMDADDHPIQGVGLLPDVVVDTVPDDFADSDPVLEAGLRWLRAQ